MVKPHNPIIIKDKISNDKTIAKISVNPFIINNSITATKNNKGNSTKLLKLFFKKKIDKPKQKKKKKIIQNLKKKAPLENIKAPFKKKSFIYNTS